MKRLVSSAVLYFEGIVFAALFLAINLFIIAVVANFEKEFVNAANFQEYAESYVAFLIGFSGIALGLCLIFYLIRLSLISIAANMPPGKMRVLAIALVPIVIILMAVFCYKLLILEMTRKTSDKYLIDYALRDIRGDLFLLDTLAWEGEECSVSPYGEHFLYLYQDRFIFCSPNRKIYRDNVTYCYFASKWGWVDRVCHQVGDP